MVYCLAIALVVTIFLYLKLKTEYAHEKQRASIQYRKVKEEKEIEVSRIQAETEQRIKEIEERIVAIRLEADQRIRETKEQISSKKNQVLLKSEKEILSEVLIYLENYATRINRLENKTDGINARISELYSDIEHTFHSSIDHRTNQCTYLRGISQSEFEEIVPNICAHHKRVNVYIENATVYGTVVSITGHSEWKFKLDFNCNGSITGNYSYQTENSSSNLPETIGDAIKKEILFRLN